MFAVPGWGISAKSLVSEKADAKSNKNNADLSQTRKRKPATFEVERSRKIQGNELEKLWNQRFGRSAGQGDQENKQSKNQGRKPEAHPDRSKLNGTLRANAGDTPSPGPNRRNNNYNNNDNSSGDDASKNLSRKQKKLRNLLKREQQGIHSVPNGATSVNGSSHFPPSRTEDSTDEPSTLSSQQPNKKNQRHARETEAHAQKQKHANVLRTSTASTNVDQQQPKQGRKPQSPTRPATVSQHAESQRTKSQPSTSETLQTMASLPPAPPPASISNLTPLQSKMALKLTSARFRHLNQQLYTTPSSASLSLFSTQPTLFNEYHSGFTHQTHSWPVNPVSVFIASLQGRNDLPRRKTGSCTIADLGCGDAPLARALSASSKKLSLQIHSFDLHAANEHVTVADISNLPLRDGEADVAIFCLSLMGTNWIDFVEESWRTLRGDGKGEVWIAEVKSRFGKVVTRRAGVPVENSVGKKRKPQQQPHRQQRQKKDEDADDAFDEGVFAEDIKTSEGSDQTDISAFVQVFQRRGFTLREDSVDKSNKMFVSMIFHKTGVPTAGRHKGLKWNGKEYQRQHDGKMKFTNDEPGDADPKEEAKVLKPCVYKTR